MKKSQLKLLVDAAMTLALMLLMAFELIGRRAHEWIGVAMFLLFIIHHVLNRKWSRNLLKGRYTHFRLLQTLLVIMILICMLGSMISGIILSEYLFPFLELRSGYYLASQVHMLSAYWGFVLMSLHLGLHLRVMIRKVSGRRLLLLRAAAVVIALYGVFAFFRRGIPLYLFLLSHFVYFDFEEPLVFFYLDYLAIMGLFVFLGHYLSAFLRSRSTLVS